MKDQIYKKLHALSALQPVKENEVFIRNLTHKLLNETAYISPDRSKDLIRQQCLNCIRLLNNDIIIKSNKNDYSYECFNITYALKNIVTACEIMLCKTNVTIIFDYCNDIYAKTSYKLLISAVTEIIRLFCDTNKNAEISFSLTKNGNGVCLIAKCNNGRKHILSSVQRRQLLTKIGQLCNGRFFMAQSNINTVFALDFKGEEAYGAPTKIPPDYVQLLIDKMSDIHIGLSGLSIEENPYK